MRKVVLLLVLCTAAACGPKEPPRRPARRARTAVKRRPPARSLGFVRSKLTPRLARLVAALTATKGKVFRYKKLLSKYIPDLGDKLDEDAPELARAGVAPVKRGFLVAAFLRLSSKDYKPCSEAEGNYASNWLIFVRRDRKGTERVALTKVETGIFGDKTGKIVFPAISKHVPLFQVEYDDDGEDECEGDHMVTKTSSSVEVYHWSPAAITQVTSMEVASSANEPGNEKLSSTEVRWVRGTARYPALLILVTGEVDTNVETGGEAEGFNSTCVRTVSVSALTRNGKLKVLKAAELSALEKRIPAVARIPAHLKYRIFSDKDIARPDADDCIKGKHAPRPRPRLRQGR